MVDMAESRVFISYSWDSDQHRERVGEFSDLLRLEYQIDCWLDQYEEDPGSWPHWMERQIEQAEVVLVVCTNNYLSRFKGELGEGGGRGVRWEGTIIINHLYNVGPGDSKFIPIGFSAEDLRHTPGRDGRKSRSGPT